MIWPPPKVASRRGRIPGGANHGRARDATREEAHGVARGAGVDGDEVGYLGGRLAEVKRQR